MKPWMVDAFKRYDIAIPYADGTFLIRVGYRADGMGAYQIVGQGDPKDLCVGQVWVYAVGDEIRESAVVAVHRDLQGAMTFVFPPEIPWPPVNSILVAGPGAPWAPRESTETP
jgi:hypothetical protein